MRTRRIRMAELKLTDVFNPHFVMHIFGLERVFKHKDAVGTGNGDGVGVGLHQLIDAMVAHASASLLFEQKPRSARTTTGAAFPASFDFTDNARLYIPCSDLARSIINFIMPAQITGVVVHSLSENLFSASFFLRQPFEHFGMVDDVEFDPEISVLVL